VLRWLLHGNSLLLLQKTCSSHLSESIRQLAPETESDEWVGLFSTVENTGRIGSEKPTYRDSRSRRFLPLVDCRIPRWRTLNLGIGNHLLNSAR
jgi:hypothetical protein